jgi:hypothetical protein
MDPGIDRLQLDPLPKPVPQNLAGQSAQFRNWKRKRRAGKLVGVRR